MADRWLNRDAVEWALYESDVDADRLPVLVAVASFTDVDGRGAYPARMLLALITRRNKSTVVRNLAELVRRGQLLPGDWRRVAHIRSDRRPNVYDLPDKYRIWLAARGRTTPPREGARRGGTVLPRRRSRGGVDDIHGVALTHSRGGVVPPEEFLKNSGKGGRADAQPSAASATPPETPNVRRVRTLLTATSDARELADRQLLAMWEDENSLDEEDLAQLTTQEKISWQRRAAIARMAAKESQR